MKAIVLSYDRQAGLAELLYRRYLALWPSCPLTFRIPFNGEDNPSLPFFRGQRNVELIRTDRGIRATMTALLEGIPDEEFVFWCIDDRYPLSVRNPRLLEAVAGELESPPDDLLAVKLLWWKEPLSRQRRRCGGAPFLLQGAKTMSGFFHHQFVRCRVLRGTFLNGEIPADYRIADINRYAYHRKQMKPEDVILIPRRPLVVLREPIWRGMLSRATFEDLVVCGCPVPDLDVVDKKYEFIDPRRSKIRDYHGGGRGLKHAIYRRQRRLRRSRAGRAAAGLSDLVLRRRTVHLVSFGGCGSKALARGVGGKGPLSRLKVRHTHENRPPGSVGKSDRVIYVFGDPYNSLISFFRRRERRHERHGMSANAGSTPQRDWVVRHCRNLGGEWQRINPRWSLADYLAEGEDLLGLEEHFDAWTGSRTDYPVLFVRYESMWDHLEEIFRFAGADAGRIGHFPKSAERTSDWRRETAAVRRELEKVYGNLHRKIMEHADIVLRPGCADPLSPPATTPPG